ncbi:hypothetical protein P7C71_g5193, partial [Lecanoromycetidae sp. Uapishka_2]
MQALSSQLMSGQFQLDPFSALVDTEQFSLRFLSESYLVLGFPIDYSIEAQPTSAVQNSAVYRFISTQAALGYAGDERPTTLPAIVARTMLHTRYIAIALGNALGKPSDNRLKTPETIDFIIPMASWSISLVNFIIDELIALSEFISDNLAQTDAEISHLLEQQARKTTSPALPLLLVSSSRAFLKFICTAISGPLSLAIKNHRHVGLLALAYRELETVIQRSPVTVLQFHHILTHLEAEIRDSYQHAGMGAEERNIIEKEMLINATIPAVLVPAVKDLLINTIGQLKEEINVAELYFTDTSILGLTVDDEHGKRWRREHPIDAMRKSELTKDAGLKRCTKCGNVTEDVQFTRSNMAMLGLQRHCLCGGWWMVLDEDEQVGGY